MESHSMERLRIMVLCGGSPRHLCKNMQALVIQIDLIGTERRPNVNDLVGSFFELG